MVTACHMSVCVCVRPGPAAVEGAIVPAEEEDVLPELKKGEWGCFTIQIKAPFKGGAGANGGYQATCPFHKK